jgi:hypothetical protein
MKPRHVSVIVTALLLVNMISGCRTVEQGSLVMSRLRSPVIISSWTVNQPLVKDLPNQPDSLEDLVRQNVVTFVCISGGGERAGRLALHTMAALEAEWNRRELQRNDRPLFVKFD